MIIVPVSIVYFGQGKDLTVLYFDYNAVSSQ